MPGDDDELTLARIKAMRKTRKALLHSIRNKLHIIGAANAFLRTHGTRDAEEKSALDDADDAFVKLMEKFLALEELL